MSNQLHYVVCGDGPLHHYTDKAGSCLNRLNLEHIKTTKKQTLFFPESCAFAVSVTDHSFLDVMPELAMFPPLHISHYVHIKNKITDTLVTHCLYLVKQNNNSDLQLCYKCKSETIKKKKMIHERKRSEDRS